MSELGTILIVDDSDTHRVVIAGELEKIGYATLAVDSGAKAIQTVASEAVDLVLLDKTGTLTEGKPRIQRLEAAAGDEADLLALAAAALADSEHPLARAVRQLAGDQGIAPVAARDFTNQTGKGVQATIGGRRLVVGNATLLAEFDVAAAEIEDIRLGDWAGLSLIHVAEISPSKVYLGCLGAADAPRAGAAAAVARLRGQGVAIIMLSGDNQAAAQGVADQVGITQVIAGVLPDGKAGQVTALRIQGHVVAMVGDGINDAPALAAADIGIAMGGGAHVAMEVSSITLMRDEPGLIADAIDISRATARRIRHNLFWAFVYNLVALPVAALGLLNPAVAGAAMAFSSVSVISNALLLRRWRPRQKELSK